MVERCMGNFVIVYVDVFALVTKTHSLFKKQRSNRQALSETFVAAYNKTIILYELLLKKFFQSSRQLIIFVPLCPDIFLRRKSRGIYKRKSVHHCSPKNKGTISWTRYLIVLCSALSNIHLSPSTFFCNCTSDRVIS